MSDLTRRAALRGGLGASLAVALSSILPAAPARAAVTNRARLSTGSAYGAQTTSIRATFPAPAAHNLLLLLVSVDGSAGKFRVPAGWTMIFQRPGTSVSLVALYRLATGEETAVTQRWSTASLGGSWLVAEYTGISGVDPLGPARVPAYSDVTRTSMLLNPPAAEAQSVQLAVFAIDALDPLPGNGGAEFRPTASGWEWITTSYAATQPSCPATALTEYGAPLAQGTDLPGTTFTWQRRDQVIGAVLQLNIGPPAPAHPSLVSRWVGAVTPTGATVAVKVANALTARLFVSTDPTMATGVIPSPPATPDANGMAKLTIDNLAPSSQYHYVVEVDGVVDASKGGSFRTGPGDAAGFTFAFGSCCNSPGAGTFSQIRGHKPDFFVHLGDLHYADIAENDPAAFRAKYDTALASAHQGPLYANVPTVYTWSDHDFGPGNTDGSSASKPAAQATYRQYVPSYPLASSTGGIHHTFTYGRIRFIVTDNRSDKSARLGVDDATKTMLGAEQKRWFKSTITSATEPVIVWVNENPWIGPVSHGSDSWNGYSTERAELASFIADSGKNVAIISGDMHALAADDGTNSPGGIPVFQAAPLNGNSSTKGGPYTLGPYPTTIEAVQQYGIVRVEDAGSVISLHLSGYRVGGSEQLTYTHSFAV